MRTVRNLVLALCAALSANALADAAAGKATYDKMCASCHGADGRGNPDKAKALKIDPATLNLGRDEVAGQTKADKRAVLESGKAKMPAYGKKLQPADLDNLADYTMELIAAIRK